MCGEPQDLALSSLYFNIFINIIDKEMERNIIGWDK